jgi:hypothetical protein
MRGRPWPVEDEKDLKDWFTSGIKELRVLSFSFDGKYSENAVYQKLLDLGLLREAEEDRKKLSSSTNLNLSSDLPSVEDTLKDLHAAVEALKTPGLDKIEVLRLRGIIAGCKEYKKMLAEYMDYLGLEAELLEGRAKIAELRKRASGNASK